MRCTHDSRGSPPDDLRQQPSPAARSLRARRPGPRPAGLQGRLQQQLARRRRGSSVPCRGRTPDSATPHPGPSPNREWMISRTGSITHSGKEHRGTASSPTTQMPEDAAGTKRVHQYPPGRTLAVELDTELPVIIGDRSPLSAHDDLQLLDRTQEVAGSSPASSTLKDPAKRAAFRLSGCGDITSVRRRPVGHQTAVPSGRRSLVQIPARTPGGDRPFGGQPVRRPPRSVGKWPRVRLARASASHRGCIGPHRSGSRSSSWPP
jgi:hypothetical protein